MPATPQPTPDTGAAGLTPVPGPTPIRMGLTAATYGMRLGADHPLRFKNALDMLAHAKTLGAGGLQIGLAGWDLDFARAMRHALERAGMFLEGQIGLPKSESDLPRFESQIRAGKEAGADIFRTVMLGGRRYETFDSAAAFDEFARRSFHSLSLAEKAARNLGVRLAVENHKDWRVEELLDILRRLDSPHLGVCVDIGNSISLLEDPHAIVEAYAPLALTSHFKDMAVAPYADGFLLSEVPLGEGFLHLRRIVSALRNANPNIRFNLEMITRDPLEVPCLTDKYWATMETLAARPLANTLELVRNHPPRHPLPSVAGLNAGQRIELEEKNNAASFANARATLGFA